jgi:hypothetical protein
LSEFLIFDFPKNTFNMQTRFQIIFEAFKVVSEDEIHELL